MFFWLTVLVSWITLLISRALGLLCPRALSGQTDKKLPESVNFHFTRQCNYSCGFCFHTAKTSFLLPLQLLGSPRHAAQGFNAAE